MIAVFDVNTPIQLAAIFKIGTVTVLVLFIIFLFVVLKQISSMNKVVTQPYLYPILLIMAWVLIGLALALFGVSVVIL